MTSAIFKMGLMFLFITLNINISAQHNGNIHYNPHNPPRSAKKFHTGIVNGFPVPATISRQAVWGNYSFQTNVLYNAKADAYTAIFNTLQLGETAEEADSLISSRINQMQNELIGLGLKGEDIFIDMISQVPIFEIEVEKKLFSKKHIEVPKGIELQKNIHIRFSKGDLLDRILAIAAKYEIYDLVKVDYFIENTAEIYKELQEKAIAYHREQIASYKPLGIDLDTFLVAFSDQYSVSFPINQYLSYQGFSSASLQRKLKENQEVDQIRKPQTMYYQSLPYESFDVIINPIIHEPVVQFTCQLQVYYQQKPSKQKPQIEIRREKEFILLTPGGQVVPLKIVDS